MNEIDLLREAEARKVLGGISRTTLWRHVKAGLLPKPIVIGVRSQRWVKAELVQAISDMASKRTA